MSISKINKDISKRLDRLEKRLSKQFVKFYNEYISYSPLGLETIKQQQGQTIANLIRKAIQDAYLEGNDIVGDAMTSQDPNFQLFISKTDINDITQLSNKLTSQFWDAAFRLKNRESTVDPETGESKKNFSKQAALTAIASMTVYNAFNTSAISKTNQVTKVSIPPSQPPTTTVSDNRQFNIEFEIPYQVVQLKGGVPVKGRVRFTTRHDADVDPKICDPLDGMEWEVDDPDIVIPIEDTHPHCRCRLIPIIEGENQTEAQNSEE